MNYRIASVLASEDASTAATKTIDLTLNKPISRLTVQYKMTNSSNVPTGHPAKALTKIEIVDGSNVLFSLSGIEAQALNFYETGRLPVNLMNYISGVQAAATIEINFGRHLWDELLALDCTKFQNPQLKISHDKSKGGSVPSASTLSVFAHVFDEKVPSLTGFLSAKEQYSYTLVTSAKENIDLARDLPYRLIMLKSLASGYQPWANYNKIKLSEDNDNRVIINDEQASDLFKLLHDYPRITEEILAGDVYQGTDVYCTPSYLAAISALGLAASDTGLYTAQSYGGSFKAYGSDGQNAQYNVSGDAPHGALAVFFGKKDIIEDWYDVTKVGNLRLTITAGSGASGTCEIVSQQLKKYSAV